MSRNKPPHCYFYSDPHFFHEKSIEYDKRPFANADEMNRELVRLYNQTVPKENSLVYWLGDIGWCKDKEKMRELIISMHGTKVLCLGNHDLKPQAMYKMGFDVVCYNMTLYINGQEVTMSHCPLKGVFREDTSQMNRHKIGEEFYGGLWHGELQESKQKFTVEDRGQFHVHGHSHKKIKKLGEVFTHNQYDIGVCGNEYKPVSMKQIMSWIDRSRDGRL